MAYSEKTKKPIGKLCQFLETPRAICTAEGSPVKTEKYTMYTFFENRYSSDQDEVVVPELASNQPIQPLRDVYIFSGPDTCLIVEGMNIIHSNPQIYTKTIFHYAKMLFDTLAVNYYQKGYREIQILFDMSGTQGLSPKCFERKRRDKTEKDVDHLILDNISDDTLLPSPTEWQDFIQIRSNKSKLLNYLSNAFVSLASKTLSSSGQKFVTSGGFQRSENDALQVGMSVTFNGVLAHEVVHNHEEADTQMWLHVKETSCKIIHIYSVDRDIGMIGLPLVSKLSKTIVVQFRLSPKKYIVLNDLEKALYGDPELNFLLEKNIDLCKLMQVLYIVSGCDFVSYWCQQSKTTFFKLFFQYAKFIVGIGVKSVDQHITGCLTQTEVPDSWESGLLAFFRLIGVVYFASNRACLHDYVSPSDLFDSIEAANALDHHHEYLEIICKATWKGAFEDTLLPSDTALMYHWKRTCWVSTVWGSSFTPIFNYPDIALYGWKPDNTAKTVSVVWDSDENMLAARENVRFYTRGCGCPTSRCLRATCRCRKNGKSCGPGCTCKNCGNQDDMIEALGDQQNQQHVPIPIQGIVKCRCSVTKCVTGNCKCKKNGKRCGQSCSCKNCENQHVEVLQLALTPVATENEPNAFNVCEILESQNLGQQTQETVDNTSQEVYVEQDLNEMYEIAESDLEDSDLSEPSDNETNDRDNDYYSFDWNVDELERDGDELERDGDALV